MKKVTLLSAFVLSTFIWSCKDDEVTTINYKLDEAKSVAEWKGHLRTGYFNEGAIMVKSENLIVENGKVMGGSFTIPVSSIVNFNLPTDSIKALLVHHLQSPDFFNITYLITSVTSYTGTEGVSGTNYQVNGDLTILGKTNPVTFPAKIDLSNNQLTVDATLKVDRTKWGITYASDPTLPDANFIVPQMDVHLKLVGSKN